MEYVRVCLLNLVKKNNRVRLASHLFSELAALLVTHVSGRRPNKSRYGELLHIFTHVNPDEVIGGVKEEPGKHLCQLGFTDPGRTEEYKSTYRLVRILQSGPVTLYRFDYLSNSFILAHNACFELLGHLEQAGTLCLCYSLNGHPGHHRNHLGNLLCINHFAILSKFFLPAFFLGFYQVENVTFLIAEAGGTLIVLVLDGAALLLLRIFELFLKGKDLLRDDNI